MTALGAVSLAGLAIIAVCLATLFRFILTARRNTTSDGAWQRMTRNPMVVAAIAGPGMVLALLIVLRVLGITHAPETPADIAKQAMASSPCSTDTRSLQRDYKYYALHAWDDFIALGLCPRSPTSETAPIRLVVTHSEILPSQLEAEVVGNLYVGDREIRDFHIHMGRVGGGRGSSWRITGWR